MSMIYHVTSRDHVFKGLKFLIASHHLAKFSGHRPCGSLIAIDIVLMDI